MLKQVAEDRNVLTRKNGGWERLWEAMAGRPLRKAAPRLRLSRTWARQPIGSRLTAVQMKDSNLPGP